MTLTAQQVSTIYRAILRRDASAAEQQAGQVAASISALSASLINAAETLNIVEPALRLYQAAYGRLPDSAGFDFWVGQVRAGAAYSTLAANFISAEEARARGVSTENSNTEFVDALYQNILDRVADQGGRDFWLQQLASNTQTRVGVLVSFSQSQEFVTALAENIDFLLAGLGNGAINLDGFTDPDPEPGVNPQIYPSLRAIDATTNNTGVTVQAHYTIAGNPNVGEGSNASLVLQASHHLSADARFTYQVRGDSSRQTGIALGVADISDFGNPSGSLQIDTLGNSALLTINIANDTVIEGAEGYVVSVFDSTGATVADVAGIISADGAGTSFLLTTAIESLTGTVNDDRFNAPRGTYQLQDTIEGGPGTDVLHTIFDQAGSYHFDNINNIEQARISFQHASADVFIDLESARIDTITVDGSTRAGSFTNILQSRNFAITNQNQDVTFGLHASANTATEISLTLSNVTGGTITLPAIENLMIVSDTDANRLDALVAPSVRNITITGNQPLDLGAQNTNVTNFNAGNSSGGVTVTSNHPSQAVSITGGCGNDVITTGAHDDTILGGAGADRIQTGAGNNQITPGAGADIVQLGTGRNIVQISALSDGGNFARAD
ncbi:MAG: DUF4214 domain-containing protein, partial [Pseudomonadota bacterium]